MQEIEKIVNWLEKYAFKNYGNLKFEQDYHNKEQGTIEFEMDWNGLSQTLWNDIISGIVDDAVHLWMKWYVSSTMLKEERDQHEE